MAHFVDVTWPEESGLRTQVTASSFTNSASGVTVLTYTVPSSITGLGSVVSSTTDGREFMYRVCVYSRTTTAGTGAGQAVSYTVTFTDPRLGTSQTKTICTGQINTLNTVVRGSTILCAKPGTTITVTRTGSGTITTAAVCLSDLTLEAL